jgi:predicted nucleic acid-binding Zn ribbon protein
MRCVVCSSLLQGLQRRFCSYRCKVRGQSNAIYANQKKRGISRKNKLLLEKGGKCARCGYDRCLRALTFHHRDPSSKAFPLDVRNCANRSLEILAAEASKCDLLCENCHRELEDELYRAGILQLGKTLSAPNLDARARAPGHSGSSLRCVSCSSALKGRQRRFCSHRCKSKEYSQVHFACQKRQGLNCKKALLLAKGGKCSRCGYAGCLRALTFHHRDPADKAFGLDVRSCGRRSPEALASEADKCDLLCANCHAEVEEELYLARSREPLVLDAEAC